MPRPPKLRTISTHFRFTPKFHDALAEAAAKKGVTMTRLIETAVHDLLKHQPEIRAGEAL